MALNFLMTTQALLRDQNGTRTTSKEIGGHRLRS